MNERPLAAATVSPLRVRLDAESEQVLVARLACSTIGGVMNSGRVPPRRGFASPAKKRSKRNAWQSHEHATELFATI